MHQYYHSLLYIYGIHAFICNFFNFLLTITKLYMFLEDNIMSEIEFKEFTICKSL